MRHKSIVTLKASRKVAEESVWIAKSSVDAVDDYRLSCLPQTVHRYSPVMYLTVAIIPLICVIIQESEMQSPREEVVQSFRKALNLLQEMAPSFTLAQLMLRRLEAAVTVSNAIIDRNNTQSRESVDNDSSISGVRDASMSQGLTALFGLTRCWELKILYSGQKALETRLVMERSGNPLIRIYLRLTTNLIGTRLLLLCEYDIAWLWLFLLRVLVLCSDKVQRFMNDERKEPQQVASTAYGENQNPNLDSCKKISGCC
jgi:hypothetical protein